MIENKTIEKKIVVDCSINDMWWKWTTHEGLLTFFGPDNKIDFRIGGEFEIYFLLDNPIGLKGGEGCKILSYQPKKMLSFTWNAPPQYPKIRNHEYKTWVIVYFDEVSTDKTEMKLSHIGWPEGDDWNKVYEYFESAWDIVLDWLKESCIR